MNALNPDVFILRHNLMRYRSGAELDVAYLGSLSADAVPALAQMLEEFPEWREEAGPWLHLHLKRLDDRRAAGGWPGAHLAFNQAYSALADERDRIESYDYPPDYWFRD